MLSENSVKKKSKIQTKIDDVNKEQDDTSESEQENNSKSIIEFCKVCDAVYYNKTVDNKLMNICRNCGYQSISNNPVVYSNNYGQIRGNLRLNPGINKYLEFDKTLPRTNKVSCPKCNKNNVVFYKYAPGEDMALEFRCISGECDGVWRR